MEGKGHEINLLQLIDAKILTVKQNLLECNNVPLIPLYKGNLPLTFLKKCH